MICSVITRAFIDLHKLMQGLSRLKYLRIILLLSKLRQATKSLRKRINTSRDKVVRSTFSTKTRES